MNVPLGQRVRTALRVLNGSAYKRAAGIIHDAGYGGTYGEPPPAPVTAEPLLFHQSEAVNAAVSAFANRIASTDLMLYARQRDGELKDVRQHDALAVLAAPNPFMTQYELLWHTISDLKLSGNAYWFLAGPQRGKPQEIWRMNPRYVRVVRDKRDYITGYVFDLEGQHIPLTDGEVIHYRNPSPLDEFYGIGDLAAAALAARTGVDMDKWNRSMFARDYAVPAGIVSTDATVAEPEWLRVQDEWRAAHGSGQRRTAFVRGASKLQFTPVGMNQTDVDFLNGALWQAEKIYRVFGTYHLLPSKANDDRKVNERQFLEEHAYPLCQYIGQVLTAQYLTFWGPVGGAGQLVAEFEDIRPRERALDLDEQKDEASGMTVNEWRAKKNMKPLDGGDDLMYVHMTAGEKLKMELDAMPAPLPPATVAPPVPQGEPPQEHPQSDAAQPQDAQQRAEVRESAGDEVGDKIGAFADKRWREPDPTAMHRELGQWQTWALRRVRGTGNGRAFRTDETPGWLAELVDAALVDCGDEAAVKAVFDAAHGLVDGRLIERDSPIRHAAGKRYEITRPRFEDDFNQLLAAARVEDIDRREWGQRLRTLLRKYGEMAYRDGLNDGGVNIDEQAPLAREDVLNIKVLAADQSQYVTNFGARLFKEGGITDAQADLKPTQWWNGSIQPFYDQGRLSADKNAMMEFGGDDGEESCEDCQRLKGQVHRYYEWVERGYNPPYGENLACSGGKLCEHTLVKVGKPEVGNW